MPVQNIQGLELTDAMDALASRGFTGTFTVRPGGTLLCGACRQTPPAADMTLLASGRIEGASDPADESLVAGLQCPRCGQRGAIILPFGMRASPDETSVLKQLHRS